VDPSLAAGTGAGGRVIERDVRALMDRGGAAQDAKAAGVVSPRSSGETEAAYEDVTFTGIRKAISSALYHSLSSMAQLTHNFSFDASTILAYRKLLKEGGGDTAQITIGDMILYAVAHTLLSCPDLNAHMLDDHSIRRFKHVNLGVAVDTPRGLMVPTVFRADEKSLLEISKELKELAEAARSGAINPDLLKDGTFTVSNLGAAGVESFTPVINPPQTGLLGVCTTVDRVRKLPDGSIDVYPSMTLSMTYDHRAIDGAPLSRYVQGLCRNLESFTTLLAM
ncbi:MAG: 2-oxo acid dehydrogenase subunit E2, partial [Lachnospiraceae bacterium]|nr:2-oxo acid dehydrogenase subunit E2 [Lachnospiraceae bacterium]